MITGLQLNKNQVPPKIVSLFLALILFHFRERSEWENILLIHSVIITIYDILCIRHKTGKLNTTI